jgi:hypothetical protein
MREEGLDMGNGKLRADITRRFLWMLNRLLVRRAVTKEGWGAAAPRWTLKRLVGFVPARFGLCCCREIIALFCTGSICPGRGEEAARPVLEGAQRVQHRLVYLDQVHIHSRPRAPTLSRVVVPTLKPH